MALWTSIVGGAAALAAAAYGAKKIVSSIKGETKKDPTPMVEFTGFVPQVIRTTFTGMLQLPTQEAEYVEDWQLAAKMFPGSVPYGEIAPLIIPPTTSPPGNEQSMITGKKTKCYTHWIGDRAYWGTFPRSDSLVRWSPERECKPGEPASFWKDCRNIDADGIGCWDDQVGPMMYSAELAHDPNSYGGWIWACAVDEDLGGTADCKIMEGGGWDDMATILWSIYAGIVTGLTAGAMGAAATMIFAAGTTASGTLAAVGKAISDAQKGISDPTKTVKTIEDLANKVKTFNPEEITSLGFGE